MSDPKFRIGQRVNYTGHFGSGSSSSYVVRQLLPFEGNEFQYRIKSEAEPHDLIAKESQLDRAA